MRTGHKRKPADHASRENGYADLLCYSPSMFVETLDQCVRVVRPRSFAALMTLYEGNHARLRQLLGNLACLPGALVSSSRSDPGIHVLREKVSRYTTDLHMTYRLRVDGRCVATPDLWIRVYHDARMAEALACSEHVKWKLGSRAGVEATAVSRRWPLNILLNKWMEHCLDHGHRFAPVPVSEASMDRWRFPAQTNPAF